MINLMGFLVQKIDLQNIDEQYKLPQAKSFILFFVIVSY